jgi:hypothetical protein
MPCPSGTVPPVGIQGDTMYKSLLEADAALALTLAFAAVLFLVGALARVLDSSPRQNKTTNRTHTDLPPKQSESGAGSTAQCIPGTAPS